jgi:uncharacterized protein YbjT (DUF2867 family)
MKIVVIGGTGLIGSKLVNILREKGHEAVAASPSSGVDTIAGTGLNEALKGADVVVDVSNSPSFEDAPVLKFFETSTRNILQAEKAAGTPHHVALSIVGTDLMPGIGYMRAKVAQEKLIKAAGVPYTIVRATQFFEFIGGLADFSTQGNTVTLSSVVMQPMAADDVAAALARVATGTPVNGTVEIAGPERIRLDELARRFLQAKHDARTVVTDARPTYYGAEIPDQALVPGPGSNAQIGSIHFADWLVRSATAKSATVK